MEELSLKIRKARSYDPNDNSISKTDFLSILNSIGRFPSAEEVIIKSSTSRQRVSVYKCMKLLEPHFSHSAYNMDASLTSFEDGTPQQDPYPPYRMASPTMIGRMGGSRNPVHAHKDGLHPMYQHRDDPMYQHRDDNSDSDSQDPPPPAQSRGKPGSRSASVSKERRQGTKVDNSMDDMRYPSFTLHPTVRNGRTVENYRHGQGKHKTYSAGPRSRHENSDEEDFYPHPLSMLQGPVNPPSRRSCKQCRKHQAQLLDMKKEHDQVVYDLNMRLSECHWELDKRGQKIQELKHEVDCLRRYGKVDSESLSDHLISDYQYERMKKHYEDKISRLERALQEAGKECHYLREEWSKQKHKMRERETFLYHKEMELQQSEVEMLDNYQFHQPPRHPVNHPASVGKRYQRDRAGKGKDVRREPDHAHQVVGGLPMSRTRSDGMVVDASGGESHSDPVKEQEMFDHRHRAKSLKSLQSEDSEGMLFVVPVEELKNTFKVLGEDVSKTVFPDSLPEHIKLALIRALGNSHNREDLIRTMFSYGCAPQSTERYQELEKNYTCLKESHEHLKAQHTTLQQTFEELKVCADGLYEQSNKHMSNEVLLKLSLQYCLRVVDMVELIKELSTTPLSQGTTPLSPHFTFDSTTTPRMFATTNRVRQHLHDLDRDQQFQEFISSSPFEELLSSLSSSWSHDLSQNTTSGVSSATCSSTEGELSAEETDKLKRYAQLAFAYQKRIRAALISLTGTKDLEILKEYEVGPDAPFNAGSSHVADIENSVHMEELHAMREEKAELRSRIYMLEQEKKQADLEISRKELEFHQQEKMIQQLEQRLSEERKRKRRATRKDEGGALYPDMEEAHMYESLQMQYEELYLFLKENSRKSKDNHEKCMEFIKALHRANHALVDAYEKSMKQQRMEKKQMREELKAQLARVRGPEEPACHVGETRL